MLDKEVNELLTRVTNRAPRYPLWVLERRYMEARRKWMAADSLAKEAKKDFDEIAQKLKMEREAQRE